MVKSLEPHIKKAFSDLGFTDDEIKNGCWLLERNNKAIAWIALHKFLERVAQKLNIVFDEPKVMNCTSDEVALYVRGSTMRVNDNSLYNQAWSIGEASGKNNKNDYRWAMAEKRAKDRVILKLLGVAGDMYSEEEADEFKRQDDASGVQELKNEIKSEKAKATREFNKRVQEYQTSEEGLEIRYKNMYRLIQGMPQIDQYNRDKVLVEKIMDILDDLKKAGNEKAYKALNDLANSKMLKEEPDEIPANILEKGIKPEEFLQAG